MPLYLEPSALFALVNLEPRMSTFSAHLLGTTELLVSDFAAVELASAASIRLRTGAFSHATATALLSRFDAWREHYATAVHVTPPDIARAAALVRRFDLKLRAPDALHIALAERLGAALVTFDERQAEAARGLGLAVLPDAG